MKNLFLILLGSLVLTMAACDALDDSPCGPKQELDIYLSGSSIVDTTSGYYYSYTSGNERVFQWSEIVEQVCPLEHVSTTFRVALLDETTTGVAARGIVSWNFFFEDNFPMAKAGSDLKGQGETGLKQAFGEEPGWYVPAVEVYFPTKGSYAADTAFLKQYVISVELNSKYRQLN